MATVKDRSAAPLTDIDLILDQLELDTKRIDSKLIETLRKDGISKSSAYRVGKKAMYFEVRNEVAAMVDQMIDRFGFTNRSQVIELAVRFTIRAIVRAEARDLDARRRAVKSVVA